MGEVIVQMMRPHPPQAKIINSTTRFKVLCCGRRFGKTELVISELAHLALRGYKTAYFAPTYRMTNETWRQAIWRLGDAIKHANHNEGRIELITGGTIEFWSLSTSSAESVRGRKYHFVAIDEAAMINNLETTWNEVIRPLLVDYRGGALFTSTPKGRNYFHTLYQRGLDANNAEWESFHYPTISNPYINQSEIDSAQALNPERSFRQEYLAEFVEDAGSVFRNVSLVCLLQPQPDPVQSNPYAIGIDWGRDVDFTAISVINILTMEQVHLERFNQVGWTLQRGRIRAIYDHYLPKVVLAERNSIGDPNIEALQHEGIPVTPFNTTASSKPPLIEQLALAIERQEIKLINGYSGVGEVQMHELMAYELNRSQSGHISYSAPQGGHDDTVMALALSLEAARMRTTGTTMRQATVTGRENVRRVANNW